MNPALDLSTWLTDAVAGARLGCSKRSLDREAVAGRLHPLTRQVPGRRGERVWDPDEIEARMPQRHAHLALAIAPVLPPMAELTRARADDALLATALERLGHVFEVQLGAIVKAAVPPKPLPAYFLTIPQASEHTGLSQTVLRRFVRSKKLPSIRDGAIRVSRAHLDAMAREWAAELAEPARGASAG